MRTPILIAAALASAAPPAFAQDAPASAPEAAPHADLAERMRDPEHQREVALMAQTMAEVLLDLPIAPLAQAAAETAGDHARQIDPDLTLRKIVPDAGKLSEAIGRTTPQAMRAAGTLAGVMAAMTPALRNWAKQMARALPEQK